MKIVQANTELEINQARALFREYERWLDVGLCFQNFEKELTELPGAYESHFGVRQFPQPHFAPHPGPSACAPVILRLLIYKLLLMLHHS